MENKQILVYHARELGKPHEYDSTLFKKWTPSLKQPIPSGKPPKYLIYSVFSFLRIFKNINYVHYYTKHKSEIASSFLVMPAYFRWPFMQSRSVQFTYVMTVEEHKGKGLAWQGIYKAYQDLKSKGVENFWYVTDTKNMASQRLAQKMGFNFVGTAHNQKVFFIIKMLCLDEAK